MEKEHAQHIVNQGPVGVQANTAGSGNTVSINTPRVNVLQVADRLKAEGDREVGDLLRALQESVAEEKEKDAIERAEEVQKAVEEVAVELALEPARRDQNRLKKALEIIAGSTVAGTVTVAAQELLKALF